MSETIEANGDGMAIGEVHAKQFDILSVRDPAANLVFRVTHDGVFELGEGMSTNDAGVAFAKIVNDILESTKDSRIKALEKEIDDLELGLPVSRP